MARAGWGVIGFVVLLGLGSALNHQDRSVVDSRVSTAPTAPAQTLVSPTLAIPAPPSEPAPQLRDMFVTATKLNVRSAPNSSAEVVGFVSSGGRVSIGEVRGDWAAVSLKDGRTGWVSTRFLSDTRPPAAAPLAKPKQPAAPAFNRGQVVQQIIQASIRATGGSCPCPYNTDRRGRSCGARSAYTKPGGASPICYPDQVSDAMIAEFIARQ